VRITLRVGHTSIKAVQMPQVSNSRRPQRAIGMKKEGEPGELAHPVPPGGVVAARAVAQRAGALRSLPLAETEDDEHRASLRITGPQGAGRFCPHGGRGIRLSRIVSPQGGPTGLWRSLVARLTGGQGVYPVLVGPNN